MARIRLHTLVLQAADDPSDAMAFPLMSSLSAAPETFGENRMYANGRIRSINRAGRVQQLAANLPACSREQVAWLEAHSGQLLMVRDDRGRLFYGNFRQPSVEEHAYDLDADVSLTLSQVTRTGDG